MSVLTVTGLSDMASNPTKNKNATANNKPHFMLEWAENITWQWSMAKTVTDRQMVSQFATPVYCQFLLLQE